MFWFRIDNRLIHGQVIEAWLPYLRATHLVVANDALAEDHMRQQIMQLAVPGRVTVYFVAINDAKALYDRLTLQDKPCLFLLNDCPDAQRLMESGIAMPVLNIGNLHHCQGKKQICAHVAASDKDMHCLRRITEQGTELDFRCVPGDKPDLECIATELSPPEDR